MNTLAPSRLALDLLETQLRSAGFYTEESCTGGNCWALLVHQHGISFETGTYVLITNGDAQLPYLSDEGVDQEIVACVYQGWDDEGRVIVDHPADEGTLPQSVIVAAVKSVLS